MKESDGVEPLRVIAQNPWEKKKSSYNTSSEVWDKNAKNEKWKPVVYTVEVVKWLQFISVKLVHLSLNFTPQR